MNTKIAVIVVIVILVIWYFGRPRVEFHTAEWCPYCKEAKPMWDKVKSENWLWYNMVEVEQHKDITSFPTVLMRRYPFSETVQYSGAMKQDEFMAWLEGAQSS